MEYGHLAFPFNSDTKNLFLIDKDKILYKISKNGVESSNFKYLSDSLVIYLKKKGFSTIPVEKKYIENKKNIYNCDIDCEVHISKIIKNKEIKQVLVRISGEDSDELSQNIKKIKEYLQIYNIKSDDHTFSKTNRC